VLHGSGGTSQLVCAEELGAILRRLEPAADPDGAALVHRAYEVAVALHGHQLRKDGSTILQHVLGVTAKALDFGVRSPWVIAAALLHDVLENTDMTLEELVSMFGAKVAGLVDALTNRPGDDDAISVRRARRQGREALLLRLCDRLDGLERVSARPEKARTRFLAATRRYYLPVAEESFPEIAQAMRRALEAAEPATGGASRSSSTTEEVEG